MGLFSAIAQGLGGLFGDILGAQSNSHAIAHATNQQIGEIDKAIGEQQREYDTTRSDFQPYMLFGKDALGPLGDLLGMNGGDKAAAAIAALKASPLFTSLFNTGQEATLQNASATGGIRGGNTEGALYELGQGTLAQVVQQQISNLFGAAGVGQGATGSVANVGAHTADNISSGYTSIGNSLFNKTIGQQQVYNNLGSQIQNLLSSIPVGGF
jgi:hypothetical protein